MPKPQTQSATIAPTFTPTEREAQRVAHLVLGAPRPPREMPSKPQGLSKQEWRARKIELRKVPVVLAPGIEEAVQLRERWSHKTNCTPETLEHVDAEQRREGSLARLLKTGAIDGHQLAAAERIQEAYYAITADVAVRTAKLEPRGSGGGPDAASAERLSAVIRDRNYTQWRERVGPHGAMLLAIIVDDMGLTAAARRWRLSNRKARTILVAALDCWGRC
jgi:hypothetical protein